MHRTRFGHWVVVKDVDKQSRIGSTEHSELAQTLLGKLGAHNWYATILFWHMIKYIQEE